MSLYPENMLVKGLCASYISTMPITADSLKACLEAHFPNSEIVLTDLAGDNDHWQVRIVSDKFTGKTRIQQHQLVQAAVKDEDIHALSITTQTPE